jgi:hypothetical protein
VTPSTAGPTGPLDPLVAALANADSLPFLFVGSGVSRRYLGHENWQGLMEWAAALTDMPYRYYAGQVSGDLPGTASLIAAAAFYDRWWSAPEFEASRHQWADDQCNDVASPLKIEVAQRLSGADVLDNPELRAELELLGSCQVDGIITTNYDPLLEAIFPTYSVFTGQVDLLLRRSYQLGEIYKIHGSVDKPDSLILTAEDYREFDANSAYLVAKLMSVFVEHPIIFLGYSLSDRNVRIVLTSLLRCLSPEKIEEFKSRFIWVSCEPGRAEPVVDDHVIDLGETRLLPVLRVRTPSFEPVFEVLNTLERKLPVGVLRRVAEAVVKIVHSADPTRQLHLADLEILDSLSDDDIVIGIGAVEGSSGGSKGYLGYNRRDLIVDAINDNAQLDPKSIVTISLPDIIRHAPNAWVPVHKYVKRSGIKESDLPVDVKRAMDRSNPKGTMRVPTGAADLRLTELVDQYGIVKALDYVCSFSPSDIRPPHLRSILVDHLDVFEGGDPSIGTAFGKAAVVLDRLEYGPDAPPARRKAARASKPPPRLPRPRGGRRSSGAG